MTTLMIRYFLLSLWFFIVYLSMNFSELSLNAFFFVFLKPLKSAWLPERSADNWTETFFGWLQLIGLLVSAKWNCFHVEYASNTLPGYLQLHLCFYIVLDRASKLAGIEASWAVPSFLTITTILNIYTSLYMSMAF